LYVFLIEIYQTAPFSLKTAPDHVPAIPTA